jgi:hypothetical protein
MSKTYAGVTRAPSATFPEPRAPKLTRLVLVFALSPPLSHARAASVRRGGAPKSTTWRVRLIGRRVVDGTGARPSART